MSRGVVGSTEIVHHELTTRALPRKLTSERVAEIRAAYATGRYSAEELAKYNSVSEVTVFNVVTRRTWRSVA